MREARAGWGPAAKRLPAPARGRGADLVGAVPPARPAVKSALPCGEGGWRDALRPRRRAAQARAGSRPAAKRLPAPAGDEAPTWVGAGPHPARPAVESALPCGEGGRSSRAGDPDRQARPFGGCTTDAPVFAAPVQTIPSCSTPNPAATNDVRPESATLRCAIAKECSHGCRDQHRRAIVHRWNWGLVGPALQPLRTPMPIALPDLTNEHAVHTSFRTCSTRLAPWRRSNRSRGRARRRGDAARETRPSAT